MTRKERFDRFVTYFKANMPVAESELNYTNPFELLVAVILSAQCTDKRVNMMTPALFEAFPTPEVMAAAGSDLIFEKIKSCSYPNNKAKHLAKMAVILFEKFHSIVPDDVELLQELPGVGRKTANVVVSVAFGKPAMPVDTHVFRLANRIGLTNNSKTPLETEKELVKYFPNDVLSTAHHWLILHGRYVCIARKPKCPECGIQDICKMYQSTAKG